MLFARVFTAMFLGLSSLLVDVSQAQAQSGGSSPIDPVRGDLDTVDRDTPSGPLSQYDRNLLINVSWANLWEGPTSGKVAERSSNPRVRAVANQLMHEHHALEEVTRNTADQLDVTLPDHPNPLQDAWIRDILGKHGADADDAWANITRQAHGTIFMLISQVRAQTRNDVMRAFAQKANDTVLRHMTLLESTRLVRANALYVGSADMAPHQPLPHRKKILGGVAAALAVAALTVLLVRALARYEPRTAPE
jgi:putative membrane protein